MKVNGKTEKIYAQKVNNKRDQDTQETHFWELEDDHDIDGYGSK